MTGLIKRDRLLCLAEFGDGEVRTKAHFRKLATSLCEFAYKATDKTVNKTYIPKRSCSVQNYFT